MNTKIAEVGRESVIEAEGSPVRSEEEELAPLLAPDV